MANLYYREDLDDSDFVVGGTVEVLGDDARHAVRVSRLRVGERILVGNGAGAIGEGEVVSASSERFSVRLDEARIDPEPTPSLTLVQALAKGDRDERAVEQATEFGVDRIVPWQAERSVSRWDGPGGKVSEKAAKGVAKWRRIAREASKQSLRARLSEVSPLAGTIGLVALAGGSGGDLPAEEDSPNRPAVLVLHPRGEQNLSAYARTLHEAPVEQRATEIVLVVGPEGGLSPTELEALESAGAAILRLGDTVLRTSSAGPAALAVLNVALGRW